MSKVPKEAPPSYDEAVAPGTSSSTSASSSTLHPPRNGISAAARRSMEDVGRQLPEGWIRQFDMRASHHFYVDTRADPPRSIWTHPYDDEQYLSSLPSAERERIEETKRHPSMPDIIAMSSDEEDADEDHVNPYKTSKQTAGKSDELPARPEKKAFGRKMKDKLTGTTHEERDAKRRERAEQEQKTYEAHQRYRQAMQVAMQTGQPQLLGKDRDGRDVYIEAPSYQGGYGGYGASGYGINPYQAQHHDPNARYISPAQPYRRPYGYGYGGGYGLPLAGGLAGGMLLGGALGGFGGGGFGL